MNILNVGGAYGRVYNTWKEVMIDWEDGKDFRSKYGYLSIRDINHIKDDGYDYVAFLNYAHEIIVLIRI